MMDGDQINWGRAFGGGTLAWAVISFLWMLRINAGRVTKTEIDDIRTKVIKLESTVEQLPTKEMVHSIDKEIAVLVGRINTQTETMKPIAASVSRIDNFLLTHN